MAGLGVAYGASSLLRDVDTVPEVLGATSSSDYVNETLALARPTVAISNNVSDANNDIDFSAGFAWDKVNLRPMALTAMTKRLDASWAAGTAAGGLFSGAKAADTWYYCFVIRKTSDGSIDCGFSTSKTASDIPAGYSGYRRVGAIRTDASSNIRAFERLLPDKIRFATAINNKADGAIPNTTRNTTTTTVPPNFPGLIRFKAGVSSGLHWFWLESTSFPDVAASGPTNAYQMQTGAHQFDKEVMVDASSQIAWRGSNIAVFLWISTIGFVDNLED